MAKINFEDSMQKLEEIVESLEKGDLTLEESLARYENGIKIYKQCVTLLEGIEKKIQVLTRSEDGQSLTKEFSYDDSKSPSE